MKKLLIGILFIFITCAVNAQLTGAGTFASPYKGTLNQNVTWSSDVFIGGDILTSAYQLIINPGIKVIFVTDSADIKIRGTGRLIADGTPGSQILFTADDNNNGFYGESGERWGHISFESMGAAGSSIIDNCIIEYGDVRNAAGSDNPFKYGGAIHVGFSNLTISNSIIRYNKAKWGGAIFVNQNCSPSISNCLILGNESDRAGGGFYFWTGASSVVQNCIFDSNKCLETIQAFYSGGGLATQSGCSVKVENCTFVNNTSTQPTGQSILLYGSTNDLVINCIMWGSGTHIYRSGSNTINYSAVQGSAPSGTGNFVLNSSNTAPDGPNFTATDGSDWSIRFASPCRDAGTTPSPAIPNDYAGNSRLGAYDIGAFEVLYNRWKTTASSTDWATAANWDGGIPTASSNVVIPTGATNYPTGSASQNHTIGSGYQMVVEQGACLTLGTLTNNGTLKLYSTTDGTASLIVTTYSKGGGATEEIQLFLTGGGTKTPLTYKWHYISSPLTSLAVSTFAPTYTLDLAQWVENRPSTSLTQGWVAYDGYIYSTGGMGGPTFSTLDPGKGYDYYRSTDHTYTFSGQLNTSNVNASLSYKAGNDNIWGYNLIGNPFSSGLDWDYIITHSFPANTTKSLYFTRNSVLCTYIAGVGVPGDVSGIIPPMQGFFTKTYSTGNTIALAAAARTHSNIHARYKGGQIIPLVRLSLTDDSLSDETVVRFDADAKSYLDYDFDAQKMFLDPDLVSIYSTMAGTDYTIKGLPFPETFVEIPVTINIVTDTTLHSISATQLQGLDEYRVELKDNVTGFTTNLRTNPVVTFSASKGNIAGRFVLRISNVITSIENPVHSQNKFNIYPSDRRVNIQTLADEWDGKTGSVRVLDITGKTVGNLQNAEFSKNSLIQVEAPASKGIYIVELKSGMMRYVGKIIIR